MNVRAVKTIWLREIRVHIRDKAVVVSSIARSIIWLAVFGGGFGVARFQGLDVGYQEFIFPGIVVMSLLFTSIKSGISVIWDREFGFMKEILVSPASRFSIMAGKVLGGSTIAVVEALVILLLGPIFGVHLDLAKIIFSVCIMFLVSFILVSIGLIVSSVMRTFEGFQTIMTFLVMPMFFLSGALFPPNTLPAWMALIAAINPAAYGVDALRHVLVGFGYRSMLADLSIMFALMAVTVSLGVRAFKDRD